MRLTRNCRSAFFCAAKADAAAVTTANVAALLRNNLAPGAARRMKARTRRATQSGTRIEIVAGAREFVGVDIGDDEPGFTRQSCRFGNGMIEPQAKLP